MIKHIVFWRLKEEARADAVCIAENLRPRFDALVGVVDGLLSSELGVNFGEGEYHLALCCNFTSRGALEGYQKHPAHLAIKEDVQKNVCGRACVDYEL